MNIQKQYQAKLTTAEEAVKVVKSGDWVDYTWGVCTPDALDRALAARSGELFDVKVRGGIIMKEPEIFKVDNVTEHFSWNSWHMTGIERKAIAKGFSYYAPIRYSELPRYYYDIDSKPDVAMFQVTPMDSQGYFSFGLEASHLKAVCDTARTVIVEVNPNMPYAYGDETTKVHICDVDMIVENDGPALPTLDGNNVPMTDIDKKVAEYIVEEICDGACIQLGIGGMPNAVGKMIAESDLKDLGVHTEMYVDAYYELAKSGKVTGRRKNIHPGKQMYAFAAGSHELYEYIDNNPEVVSASVGYVNDIRTISALDNFMSINNAVNFDLFGQVNAESAGTRHISGSGGQLDFVLGAYLSRGGKSFICCSSTFTDKNGNTQSRILPTLTQGSIITDTRCNTQFLVTEYGKANLKGLSTWQRAEAIIGIAHPDFQDQLIKEADKMGIWKRSNK